MMRLPRPQCISHGAPLMPSHVADDEIARHHALKNKIASLPKGVLSLLFLTLDHGAAVHEFYQT
jgi:hypothetical protein